MLTRIIALLAAGLLPAFALEDDHPEKDAARGDAIQAAWKAKDAAALKALLRPCDRTVGECATSSGRTIFLGGLLSDPTRDPEEACRVVLLEYGVRAGPELLLNQRHFDSFKKHYPNFATTLGREGLTFACGAGFDEMLQSLLKAGVAPQGDDLVIAVKRSRPGIVKMLLEAGVSKDTQGEYDGKKMPVAEIARRRMAFGVLEALGAYARYASELDPQRKDRPGPEGGRYAGDWSFRAALTMRFTLQADGSGLVGFPDEPTNPFLWKVAQGSEKRFIEIRSVPGQEEKWGRWPDPLMLEVKAENLVLQTRDGPVTGTRVNTDPDQRAALQARTKAQPYAGPVGEWVVAFDLCKIPAEVKEQARQQLKDFRITIGPDGTGEAKGPLTGQLTAQIGEKPDEVRILDNVGTPCVLKGSDNWKHLTMSDPGGAQAIVFERVEK